LQIKPALSFACPELDAQALLMIGGANNSNLKRIEADFHVQIHGHAGQWSVVGEKAELALVALQALKEKAEAKQQNPRAIDDVMREIRSQDMQLDNESDLITLAAGRRSIQGKTPNQRRYISDIQHHTLTLGIGPAGCGKTYLAVAHAVVALQTHQVEKIILTRPAVEAGEKLGFLPGDLQQKVDPYLRPLFDALADMIGAEKMAAFMEQGTIEIAPLAYMRGRTLNDAFVILDEAQNTTRAQMKMFLTRLGFGSKMVVTGDVTQVDLPKESDSGLLHALHVLEGVKDIGVCRLNSKDVIRHRLVERIVKAYDKHG